MLKISMLGAGSGFVLNIARELLTEEIFEGTELALVDISENRLLAAEKAVSEIFQNRNIRLTCSTDRKNALEGSDYVIASCEINRYANWAKDIKIPERYGVFQILGENGGPGGVIHALRNIEMFKGILSDMEVLCPQAWLMNFTNPMSYLCTYFKNYSPIKALGFCHQVHGSFGVIAEQLGMEPGELEVVSAGVNHLNWLFDVRRKGTRQSWLAEFLERVRKSEYWLANHKNIPAQKFTLEVLNTFGMYPIGYDDHIIEYLPFFWEQEEWAAHGYKSPRRTYERLAENREYTLEMQNLLGKTYESPPFPGDSSHPYYAETPCKVIHALETNTPLYLDAINIKNHGAVSNLPPDVILDVPAVVVGGDVRSVHVGALPPGPAEICRRQTALHEMLAQAAHEGDESLVIQALCLDPYVRSVSQARNIWRDFRKEYRELLPSFDSQSFD